MATPLMESNIYALWVSGQHDNATPATVAVKRLIQVGGDIDNNRDDKSEEYSDLNRFGSETDYVDTIVGTGTPAIQATSNELAYLCYLFFGGEVFTSKVVATSPPKFVFTPGANTGFWSTWWKRVGQSTILRQKFNKAKIISLRLEGSTANKVCKVTPNIISLDPGEVFTVDPSPGMPAQLPFLYTEGEGAFVIDGTTFRGQSQFAVVINDASVPVYGDSPVPMDIVPGKAQVMLEGVTIHLDGDELARYNTQVYGTAAPTAGTKPIKTIPSLGSYTATLTKPDPAGNADAKQSLKIEVPGVKWSAAVATAPAAAGGTVEHALAGAMRTVSGQPQVRITIETGAGDNIAHALP